MNNINILVLVSGGGTNLQSLIDAEKNGDFNFDSYCGNISLVISDREGVYALERARVAGIAGIIEKPDKKLPKPERRRELSDRILRHCREKNIGLIVYSGFLSLLRGDIIEEYAGKMINIHPALLPKFGGLGMYGENVHRAVLEAGETESGCTIHLVDAGTDTGPVLLQRKVPVLPGDTTEILAARVLIEEHIAIVDGVKLMLKSLNNAPCDGIKQR